MSSITIKDLVKGLKGIDIVKFDSGLNIWFHPDIDHRAFWQAVRSNNIAFKYMGIDEVGGRHGDCYFFPF